MAGFTMPDITSRIGDLLGVLVQLSSNLYREESSEEIATDMGRVYRRFMEEYQPRKHANFRTTGHNNTPIHKGWRPSRWPYVYRYIGGANMRFYNVSEHLEFQRFGITRRGYQIPYYTHAGQKRLSFIWPTTQPQEVRNPPGVFVAPGWYALRAITHPGFGPWGGRDFIERAVEDSEPEVLNEFVSGGRRFVFGPLDGVFK